LRDTEPRKIVWLFYVVISFKTIDRQRRKIVISSKTRNLPLVPSRPAGKGVEMIGTLSLNNYFIKIATLAT